MRYLSLFSGMEAASVAWHPLGWEAVAFAEVEPFPCALLKHHYPHVPNLGDVTKITDGQIAALGPIDMVVGGSPCQDLSVAGKRAGLSGARSSLFHEQLRVFHAARSFCSARFLLWENVPGAFSSNKGADFARVVGEMAGCPLDVPPDGWGSEGVAVGANGLVEWAVLDAQWFGVAQRRKRVFALLDTGNWRDRPPILLEPDCLRGDTAPRREEGEEVAGTFTSRARSGGWGGSADLAAAGYMQVAAPVPPCIGSSGAPFARPGNDRVEAGALIVSAPVTSKWAKGSGGPAGDEVQNLVINPILDVRRLMPVECERLQGFPDNYSLVPYRGKPAENCPDSPRYKALGNSMAVPVMAWIGQKIDGAVWSTKNE